MQLTIYKLRFEYFTILVLIAQVHIICAAECKFHSGINHIYDQILNLNLKEAKEAIRLSVDKESNSAYILLEDYIDFFQLFIYEEEKDYKQLNANKLIRLEKIRKSDLEEKWSLFLQSEILLHWSLIHLKRSENWKAFQCVEDAYKKLTLCKKKYPDFKFSNKSLGILHTLIGTIPEELEWASSLLGFKGGLQEGKKELEEFIEFGKNEKNLFQAEAIAAYSFVISYLDNKSKEGLQYWQSHTTKEKQFLLYHFVSTKLLTRALKITEARKLIQEKTEEEKKKLPYLYFTHGLLKLQNLDYSCEQDFLTYQRIYKGNSYIKESYQKLAWTYLIKGSEPKYKLNIQNCATQGKAITDEDRQAEAEAKSKIIPDPVLLKARLLFDGAQYNRAYILLFKRLEQYYNSDKKLEFCYRLGRICHLLDRRKEAYSYYEDSYRMDKDTRSYLAAYSHYYMGLLHEENGEKAEACKVFYTVLGEKPEQYSRSLHQKAKTGLARLACQNP